MNLGALLKMLGVKIPPETVAQIEAILPQLPQKIQGVIVLVNQAVQNFDERLQNIETILEELRGRSDDSNSPRPAGIGATQRELERRGIPNGIG